MTKSPFKFLDAYTAADEAIFFGRTVEGQTLYQYVHATSLVLLYGPSGTGKTSLVQCGLSKRFDGPDWHPFFIRRGNDINQAWRSELWAALPRPPASDDLPTLVNAVFRHYFRPVYLIFDQFEELFSLSARTTDESRAEQQLFFKSLSELIAQPSIPCKVILVMREEFIGQLYHFEKEVPTLFDYRLRVEPMNSLTIREVIIRTFDQFGIVSQPPELAHEIGDRLLKGQVTGQLAYLQVYLDQLWQQAGEADGPAKTDSGSSASKVISRQTLDQTGEVDQVLARYLIQQEETIGKELRLTTNAVRAVLDCFVTSDGTKQPISYKEEKNKLLKADKVQVGQFGFTTATKSECLILLEQARLIRWDGRFMEVTHDALASIINQLRTPEQKRIATLQQLIRGSYEQARNGSRSYLNEFNVAEYDVFRNRLELTAAEVGFVEASRKDNRKAATQRTTRFWAIMVAIAALLLLAIIGGLYWQSEEYNWEAKKNLADYNNAKAALLMLDAQTYANSTDYEAALAKLNEASGLSPGNKKVDSLYQAITKQLTTNPAHSLP